MLTSRSSIAAVLLRHEVLHGHLVGDLLDVGVRCPLRLQPAASGDWKVDVPAFAGLPGPSEQLVQGVLHYRVEAAAVPGRERLRVREELVVDTHCGPPHAFSVHSVTYKCQ